MKAVEGKGGVKRGSTRNMRGVRSIKYGIPQMRGNIGNTRRRGDMLRTSNKCLSIERLSQPLIGNDSLYRLSSTLFRVCIVYESMHTVKCT